MWNWFWNGVMDYPRQLLQSTLGLDLSADWMVLGTKIGVILLALFIGWFVFTEIATRFRDIRRRREMREMETSFQGKKPVYGDDLPAGSAAGSVSKAQRQEVERAIAMMKTNRYYAGMAARFAAIVKFKDAAECY